MHGDVARINRIGAICVVCLLLTPMPALAQDSIQGLGDLPGGDFNSFASGVSADGSVVVGTGTPPSDDEAFRWTQATGMEGLGNPPGFHYSGAWAVNADGSVVAGWAGSSSHDEAFRWTQATGMQTLGDLPGGDRDSYAFGVNAGGSVVVGRGESANGTEAFRWTEVTGMEGMGYLPGGGFYSRAFGVNADGSVVVGGSNSANGYEAFRWTQATGMQGLGDLPGGGFHSEARGVNADGSVVVGYSCTTNVCSWYHGGEAFRWTEATGMQGLGHLPGSNGSRALAVNADGSVVVGYSILTRCNEAFRWTQAEGMQSIAQLLTEQGVDLTDWQLDRATGVSADGSVIVGTGFSDDGYEAWLIHLNAGLISMSDYFDSLQSTRVVTAMAAGTLRQSLYGFQGAGLQHRCPHTEGWVWYADVGGAAWRSGAFDADEGRFSFGVVTEPEPDWHFGAGVTLSSQKGNMLFGGNTTIDGPQVGLFTAYRPKRPGLRMSLALATALMDARIERGYYNGSELQFSNGSSGVHQYGMLGRIGWGVPVSEKVWLTPFSEMLWMGSTLDAYTETDGGFPASFSGRTDATHEIRLGTEAVLLAGHNYSLRAWALWSHRLDGGAPTVNGELLRIGGFCLPGYSYDRDWAETGLGIVCVPRRHVRLSAMVHSGLGNSALPNVAGSLTSTVAF